jgi:putative ABC transport system substrate-binding protein
MNQPSSPISMLLSRHTRRREFVAGLAGAAAWPLAARAQQPMPVIGFLSSASPGPYSPVVAAVRQGLAEAGYVEGQNLTIVYRWADSQLQRLPALAAELVARNVSAILTSGAVPPALAAKAATSTIPIVFHMGNDPVGAGVVSSLNRPGGNITGVSVLTTGTVSKRLGLVGELLPAATVIGALVNPTGPPMQAVIDELEAAVRQLSLSLHVVRASSQQGLADAFEALAQRKVGALIVNGDPFFRTRTDQIVALAAHHAIPAIYSDRDYARSGGLVSYGPSIVDASRLQGVYAAKILKGEKPGDLPVVQAAKFELVANLKTAKALNLSFLSSLLARADEVIE